MICCPNNFDYDQPLGEGVVRITALANFDRWRALPPEEYQPAKQAWYERMIGIGRAARGRLPLAHRRHRHVHADHDPAIHRPRQRRRLRRPSKRMDGTTHLKNLFLCGTDQGFVGIIGAMFSGIPMANRHLLRVAGADDAQAAELALQDLT